MWRRPVASKVMPGFNLAPAWTFLSALGAAPLRPWHTWIRTTEERFRPPRVEPHQAIVRDACRAVAAGSFGSQAPAARILWERGSGRVPTIVLGGFVPDSTEQIFLLRRHLLRSGDVYCVNYPREGFGLDLIGAQITDLVAELGARGTPPVLMGVSFGAGVVLEWLRRARSSGVEPLVAGVVLVSPVTCVADVLPAMNVKPATLLGRALRPFLVEGGEPEQTVERSRAVFARMFEAGAQNKRALSLL